MLLALATASPALAAEPKIYVSGRASVGYPANTVGVAQSYGGELGAVFADRNALGLRVLAMPDPPDVYGSDTPSIAFGPSITWSYLARVGDRFDLYPTAGLGFGVGQSPVDSRNMILPVLQVGLGARLHFEGQSDGGLFVAPELGLVPLLLAPYMSINVGGLFSAN